MNPSVGLAVALAAASLSPLAYGEAGAIPAGLCVRAAAPAAADPKEPELFDASRDVLDAAGRARVGAAGARLDAKTCRLLAEDGHALTRREVEALTGKKPDAAGKPKADEAKKNAAAKLALGTLAAAGGTAGTYADSARRFDGARGGGADAALAGSAPGRGSPELQASASLAVGLRQNFEKEASGRELLAHFTDAEGAVRLPPVVLADLGGGSIAAVFDRETKTVRLDQKSVAQFVVDGAPEAERASLSRKLSDPARLSAYLLDHPDAKAEVLDGVDVTVFHELTHAWQQRRDPAVDALDEKNPVEGELEAYRQELLYYHEKVMRDPSLAARSSDDQLYRVLLRGYPEFKTYVVALYQSSEGISDFPTVEQILAKRAKAGRTGAASGLATVRRIQSDYQSREDEYAAKVLPAMQAEAFPKLIDRALAADRPADALALAFDAPEEIRRARGPAAFAATRKMLEADPPAPVADRLKAWDAYLAYQNETTRSNVLDADVFALYQRDRRAAVEQRLAEAAKARTRTDRDAALAWAKSYASELPEKDELLKRIAAAYRTREN